MSRTLSRLSLEETEVGTPAQQPLGASSQLKGLRLAVVLTVFQLL